MRTDGRPGFYLEESPQSAGHKSVRRGRRRPGGSRETTPLESSWDSPAAPPTDRLGPGGGAPGSEGQG